MTLVTQFTRRDCTYHGASAMHDELGCVSCQAEKRGVTPTVVAVSAPPRAWTRRRTPPRDFAPTPDERAVLECLAKGFDVADAARSLRFTKCKVRNARMRLATKLAVALSKGRNCSTANDKQIVDGARARGWLVEAAA